MTPLNLNKYFQKTSKKLLTYQVKTCEIGRKLNNEIFYMKIKWKLKINKIN